MSLGIFEAAKNTSGSHSGQTENVRLLFARGGNDLTRRTRRSVSAGPSGSPTTTKCYVWFGGFCGEKIPRDSYEIHVMSAVPHQKKLLLPLLLAQTDPFTPPDIVFLSDTKLKPNNNNNNNKAEGSPTFTVPVFRCVNSLSSLHLLRSTWWLESPVSWNSC